MNEQNSRRRRGSRIIVYSFPEGTPNAAIVKFRGKLFGRRVSVRAGKYTYYYPGYLDRVPYRKLRRGVLEVPSSEAGGLERFVRSAGAWVAVRG
jgi:hypothetical protein